MKLNGHKSVNNVVSIPRSFYWNFRPSLRLSVETEKQFQQDFFFRDVVEDEKFLWLNLKNVEWD